MNKPYIFNKYQPHLETAMKEALKDFSLPLYDMVRYHLGWIDEKGKPVQAETGKALRPTLCLLACEATGGEFERALPAASSLELIHNYSLIHDDIQDEDPFRRHRPTVWKIWGKAQGINAGTAARIIAGKIISSYADMLSPRKVFEIIALMDDTTLRLIEGQYLDISFEGKTHITINKYLSMIRNKTAELIACSLKTGSLIGCDDPAVQSAMYECGIQMGMAFQVRDDILGIWGSPHQTGKSLGGDIRKKKKTMPIVYLLNNAPASAQNRFHEIYSSPEINDNDISTVISILEDVRARGYAERSVTNYAKRAQKILETLNLSGPHHLELTNIISFLAQKIE